MVIFRYSNTEAVARQAARFVLAQARDAIAIRGTFSLAISGGTTPWRMLTWLAESDFPWAQVQIFQVDERVAPNGDKSRNWTQLERILAPKRELLEGRVHAMPVNEPDLESASASYGRLLAQVTGQPPNLDLVHLGLGSDGHTASLVPDDPVLSVWDRDVAVTRPYQSLKRMTLTYPAINRAKHVLWVVVGKEKQAATARLLNGDMSIPAGRIRAQHCTIIADSAALGT